MDHRSDIAALYASQHTWLQGWLRRQLGDSFRAADLAQDVFVRLLARQQPLRIENPRPFLATIAKGLVNDHWRRLELEQAWLDALAALPQQYAPSPEEQRLLLEALLEIDRVLGTLRPQVRKAFLLAQLDGLSCPQIASRLNISVASAERYIAQALRACYALRFGE